MKPVQIMFLCTGNSCRSQIAEGIAKHLSGNKVKVYSAGTEAHGLNPRAVETLQEIGIDISSQKSELINPQLLAQMDYVITLCGDAAERCPQISPEAQHLHWGFPDPAQATGSPEGIAAAFRKARDDIYKQVEEFLANLPV